MSENTKRPLSTSQKTIRVLDTLRKLDGAGLTELATELDMNKSTVHSHLSTLEAEELVVRDGPQYELGLRLLEFGGDVQSRNRLYMVAEPELKDLASKSGELATFTVEEYGRTVTLAIERGEHAVSLDIYPGLRQPMHLTSHGKAILSKLSPERVDEIVDRHGLPAATSKSITDRAELHEQLETIRDRGFAVDDGEFTEGLRCVAAPVQNGEDGEIGSIGVLAPENRVSSDRFHDELPEYVQSAANVVELNLDYPGPRY